MDTTNMNSTEILSEIFESYKDHNIRYLINQFQSKYRKELGYTILDKESLINCQEFYNYNKKNNKYYFTGVEIFDIDINKNINGSEEYISFLKTSGLVNKVRSYWVEKDALLDVFHNTILNNYNRTKNIESLL